jgi:Seven in absentia protein family
MTECTLESPKRQKRPRPSNDFYESLMCLICTDFFKPPVIQCNKGHSYCQSCVLKMKNCSSTERICAVCRSPIASSIRNYAIEEILSKFSVGCSWTSRGCSSQVFLSLKEEHEKTCEFRPLVDCYFKATHQCIWKGNYEDLPNHLVKTHEIQELTRNSLFRYLWNPPNEFVWRYRFRVLKQLITPDSDPFTFILEHYYSVNEKLLCFFVRSVSREIRRKYKISILNRANDVNKITYEGFTNTFEDFGHVSEFLKEDMTKLLIVPYSQLKDFCFFCEEDNSSYFSLHVQFL